MANVVQLQFADRRRTDVAHAARASAEIIIFPGVRIERWDEPRAAEPAPRKTRQRARRKRDCLELPD